MAVGFKDYYEVLGVPRTASQDDIRRAFRKLALQYHPDVAKDKKQAESRFKELNEANEVLGDPEKRRKYDALGEHWKQGEPFSPPPGSQREWRGQAPGDFEFHFDGTTGFSDFFENLFGMGGGGGFGSGRRGGASREAFSQRGRDVEADILVTLEEALRGGTRAISLRRASVCDQCGGTGVRGGQTCPRCQGTGQIERTDTYNLKIPAGVREGQLLRLGGQGEAGSMNGQSGDLFLKVRYARHPLYHVEDGDLVHDLDLPPWDAVLGASVSIPLLDGRANLKLPPGTRGGQRFRMRGFGMTKPGGERGDLFVVVNIQLPETIGEHERKLWEQLRARSTPAG